MYCTNKLYVLKTPDMKRKIEYPRVIEKKETKSFRLPVDLIKQLESYARQQHMSLNAVVVGLLRVYFTNAAGRAADDEAAANQQPAENFDGKA